MNCRWRLINQHVVPAADPSVPWEPQPSIVPDPCKYFPLSPQPAPDDPLWAGNDPTSGRLWVSVCPSDRGADDYSTWNATTDLFAERSDPYYVPNSALPDDRRIDPPTLVSRVADGMVFPVPVVEFGPDVSTVAVKVPVVLSVSGFEPVTQTGSAGSFTAVVRGVMKSVVWEPGEPVDPAKAAALVGPVVCTAAQTEPGRDVAFLFDGSAHEAGPVPTDRVCGYTYRWRSLPDRTGGEGAWPVSVTAIYEMSWTVTGPGGQIVLDGSRTVEATTETTLEVRQWTTRLVNAPADR